MPGETDRQLLRKTDGRLGSEAPVDLTHLARQTFGDAALKEEILDMFIGQLDEAVGRLPLVSGNERQRLAHGLVGSARSVGAFRLADCAADIELRPRDEAHVSRFAALAQEARAFILSLRQ